MKENRKKALCAHFGIVADNLREFAKKLTEKSKNGLIFVYHPDDECAFFFAVDKEGEDYGHVIFADCDNEKEFQISIELLNDLLTLELLDK